MTADSARAHDEKKAGPARGGVVVSQPQTYEITFTGQAGAALMAQFDDCEVSVGRGVTTLRAHLPDRAALTGLIERLSFLRLEIVDVHLIAGPPD